MENDHAMLTRWNGLLDILALKLLLVDTAFALLSWR